MDRPLRSLRLAWVLLLVAAAHPAAAGQAFYVGDDGLDSDPPAVPTAELRLLETQFIDGRPEARWEMVLQEGADVGVVWASFWVQADPLPMPPGAAAEVPLWGHVDACTWTLTLAIEEASASTCVQADAATLMTGEPQEVVFRPMEQVLLHGTRLDRLSLTISVTPAFPGQVHVVYNSTDYPSLAVLTGFDKAEHGHDPTGATSSGDAAGLGSAPTASAGVQDLAAGEAQGRPAVAGTGGAALTEEAARPAASHAAAAPAALLALAACLAAATLRRRDA